MKNTKYSDIHAHPFKSWYDQGDKIIEEALGSGLETIFVVGTSLKDSQEAIEIAKKYKTVYPTIGIHPSDVTSIKDIEKLKELYDESVVAIGEVGLDYYYENNPPKELQKKCFEAQIQFAQKKNIPVIVHNRDAHDDVFEIISKPKYKDVIFVMHTFGGNKEYAEKFLQIGAYLSFSGVLTFKNASDTRDAALVTPNEKIFTETDSPFLTPMPFRGKKNHPQNVKCTLDYLADLKGITPEKMNIQINKNIKKVFKI